MISALVILFIALQLADAWLTIGIIHAGGRELNPLLVRLDRFIREELGTHARWAWLAMAKGAAVLAVLIAWLAGAWDIPTGTVLLTLVDVFYVWLCRRNWLERRELS